MSKITFADKEDIRKVDLPRKNYIGADDVNEIKSAVNNIALLTHEVTLTKAQLNSINTDGGISVPLSEFGCVAGEGVKIDFNNSETLLFRDGVDFNASGQVIFANQAGNTVFRIAPALIEASNNNKYYFLRGSEDSIISASDLTFTCSVNITGGGPEAYIKIKLYYQIVTV